MMLELPGFVGVGAYCLESDVVRVRAVKLAGRWRLNSKWVLPLFDAVRNWSVLARSFFTDHA